MSREKDTGRSARNRWRRRRLSAGAAFSAALVAGVSLASGWPGAAASAASAAIPPGGAIIRWTEHGIPHIMASDYQGLGYGQGYAFAEQNVCVLADAIVTVRGERSRWFGPAASTSDGKNNLGSDLFYTEQDQAGAVQRLLAATGPLAPSAQARALIRGYAAGYNRYLAEHPGAGFSDPACRGAAWVTPITELDMWRLEYRQAELGASSGLDAYIGAATPPAVKAASVRPAAGPGPAPALLALTHAGLGSNAIALGKAATVSGDGMLLANPHQPWQGMQRFFEEQITIPGVLDASGVAMFGAPMVVIGHTDKLAWTHTWSTAVPAMLTRLTLVAGDPTSYLVDGKARKMIAMPVTVAVRQAGGGVGAVTRTMYRTPDGPLLVLPGALAWTTRTAYVMHDANAGNLRLIDQWLAFDRAHSVAQLRGALDRYQGIPTFNTIAADSAGAAYFGDVQVLAAADGTKVDVRAACDVLAAWNLRGDLNSPGAVLWREFSWRMEQAVGPVAMWRAPFDPSRPVTTPAGIDTDLPAVQAALAQTALAFSAGHIPLGLTLAGSQRFGGIAVPGCTDYIEGCFDVIEPGGNLGPNGAYPDVADGSSFIMAIELTPSGPKARALLTYSQSTNPASPYHADQTRMFAAKQWVTDRFTQAEILSDPTLTTQVLKP